MINQAIKSSLRMLNIITAVVIQKIMMKAEKIASGESEKIFGSIFVQNIQSQLRKNKLQFHKSYFKGYR